VQKLLYLAFILAGIMIVLSGFRSEAGAAAMLVAVFAGYDAARYDALLRHGHDRRLHRRARDHALLVPKACAPWSRKIGSERCRASAKPTRLDAKLLIRMRQNWSPPRSTRRLFCAAGASLGAARLPHRLRHHRRPRPRARLTKIPIQRPAPRRVLQSHRLAPTYPDSA